MSSTRSVSNNINRPLTAGATFTGAWENTAGSLVLGVFIASPTLGLLTIEQSNNQGTNIQLTDTFNIDAGELDNMNVFRVPSGFPFFRVLFQNAEGAQTYLSLNTYLEDFYNQSTISGVVAVTGSVVASNLITETLATRRVDFLVVGDYYRVATVGITSGAQWNAIGAIVDGESVPVIGRLFKCLQVGPAVAGGGTCYDVEFGDEVSATVTNLITETLATRRVDFLVVGDYYRVASVGITSGAQWNQIGAIIDGESVPVIGRLFKCLQIGPAVAGGGTCYDVEYTDAVSATITNFPAYPTTIAVTVAQDLSCNILNFPATQAVTGTVSLTDPTSVRVRDSYGDPITTTAGNLMVGINNIYTANPLHTILDSGTVAVSSLPAITGSVSATITTNPVIVKEKPSYTVNLNAVSITSQTIRSSAGCLSGLCLSHVGGSQFCFIKIYNSSSATPADTPLATFSVYKDTTLMIDTHAMNFSAGLCVRGTDNYAVSDDTPPTGSLKVVAFVTGYSE